MKINKILKKKKPLNKIVVVHLIIEKKKIFPSKERLYKENKHN